MSTKVTYNIIVEEIEGVNTASIYVDNALIGIGAGEMQSEAVEEASKKLLQFLRELEGFEFKEKKKYPTEKQEKYIKDLIEILTNHILSISEDFREEYINPLGVLRAKAGYIYMETMTEVSNFIKLLQIFIRMLENINKSIKYAQLVEFRHIDTKKAFLEKKEKDFSEVYDMLSDYIALPDYEELREAILLQLRDSDIEDKEN